MGKLILICVHEQSTTSPLNVDLDACACVAKYENYLSGLKVPVVSLPSVCMSDQ